MTTPTPDAAEIERLAAGLDDYENAANQGALRKKAAVALRSHAAALRERDEARRMLAEADQIVYAFVNKENWSPQKLANAAARHTSRLAAAKEKPDEQ